MLLDFPAKLVGIRFDMLKSRIFFLWITRWEHKKSTWLCHLYLT